MALDITRFAFAVFRSRSALGRVEAEARAAHAFLQVQATSHWPHVLAGMPKDPATAAESTQATIWIATNCVHSTDAGFALGGGSTVHETSPLQRRLRDLHVAAQRFVAAPQHHAYMGRQLPGSAVDHAKAAGIAP